MRVTATGTGCPIPDPDRAGPGLLVEAGGARLQFDAGRGTLMRLQAANVAPGDLDAVFLTHHHSDHVMGIVDLAHSRWLQGEDGPESALPVCIPAGPCEVFVSRALTPLAEDVAVRRAHMNRTSGPGFATSVFVPPPSPEVVWHRDDVLVRAVTVHHEPVEPAVAYRVDSSDGSVVISGDTAACPEMVELSRGADLLVHEAMRKSVVSRWPKRAIADYHTGCRELGALAEEAGVPNLMATHLIPPPRSLADAHDFACEVREGGYTGRIAVAQDLTVFRSGEVDPFSVPPESTLLVVEPPI